MDINENINLLLKIYNKKELSKIARGLGEKNVSSNKTAKNALIII